MGEQGAEGVTEEFGQRALSAFDSQVASVQAFRAAKEAGDLAEAAESSAVFALRIKRNRPVRTDGRAGLSLAAAAEDRRRAERLWRRRVESRRRRSEQEGYLHSRSVGNGDVRHPILHSTPRREREFRGETADSPEGDSGKGGSGGASSPLAAVSENTPAVRESPPLGPEESTRAEVSSATPARRTHIETAESAGAAPEAGGRGAEDPQVRETAVKLVAIGAAVVAVGEARGSYILIAIGAVLVWQAAARALQ